MKLSDAAQSKRIRRRRKKRITFIIMKVSLLGKAQEEEGTFGKF